MSPIVREYYRVPREDRATYLFPSPADLPALVQRNRLLMASWDFEFAGRPVQEFRAAARAEIAAMARQYSERWGLTLDREWADPMPLIATGHQPPPFHPGVWIKNFLAGGLAAAVGGAGLNLVVDNDEAHARIFRFPTLAAAGGDDREVRPAEVVFAMGAGGAAFEEQGLGAVRPEAVREALGLLPAPCAGPFRRYMDHVARATDAGAASVGEALAVGRRRLEEELGLRNLELPVSRLADSEAFRRLVAEMVRRPEEFLAAHNDSLAEYRRVYHERSPAQPVPDLARDGLRLELPLWVWRDGEPRRHLWVEQTPEGDRVLWAGGERAGLVQAGEAADADATAARLARLRRAGWKIRPRALSLTLFVRLAVGDVFIHGLGGALYDKVTDAMVERLFGVQPPALVLASCTMHLPLKTYPATRKDLEAARRAVRDWRFNPDRMMPDAARDRAPARDLVEEKWRLIRGRTAERDQRSRDYRRIHAINGALAAMVSDGPAGAQRDLDRVRRQLRLNAILKNREYPFCVYPVEDLAAFYREAVRLGSMEESR